MTKEEAYDAIISPLMSQIIDACKEHKIPMVADFSLDADEGLQCTTVLFGDDWPLTDSMDRAAKAMKPPERSPLMVTTRDGSGKVVSMTAIL